MLGKVIVAALLSSALLPTATLASDADTMPAGTELNFRLITALSTKINHVGDPFSGEIDSPVFSGNAEILPTGSTVEGHIDLLQPAGRQRAKMRLVIDSITPPPGTGFHP